MCAHYTTVCRIISSKTGRYVAYTTQARNFRATYRIALGRYHQDLAGL
jgi:hypothetical protein